jgi:hypothetical protein
MDKRTFWAAPASEAQRQMIQFLENVAIGGGLLAVIGAGRGTLSIDPRSTRRDGRGARAGRRGASCRERRFVDQSPSSLTRFLGRSSAM